MKRLYILLLLFIISLGISAQDYYWYKGKKIYFEQLKERAAEMPSLNKYLLPFESNSSDRSDSFTTNRFLVKLKNASDYPLLLQYANFVTDSSLSSTKARSIMLLVLGQDNEFVNICL